MSDCSDTARFSIFTDVVTALFVTQLVSRETAAVSAQVLSTPYSHGPVYCMTLRETAYIGWMHVCLVVTCRPHFLQNDRDLLHATAVTDTGKRGVGGGGGIPKQESAQKVDTGRRKFSRRSCPDLNPRSFDHESVAPTAELSRPLHFIARPTTPNRSRSVLQTGNDALLPSF